MSDVNSVLVVDDDQAVGRMMVALLGQDGLKATLVSNGEAALLALEAAPYDLVISDVRMPGLDGMGLLRAMRATMPEVPVVLMTGNGSVPLAVEAMREGASDFLLKPVERDQLLFVARKALDLSRASRACPPAPSPAEKSTTDGMVGSSPALNEARELIRKSAKASSTVLIRGETGTGKELAARAIHALSPRAKKPFVRLNCGSIPETLFESELYGYEKGAFTGAVARKPGRVELAEGGTLFLDEVGELPLMVQAKLLHLLQEKQYERLGGTEMLKADVRIVAATHRPLEQMVEQKTFRQDLLQRLDVLTVTLPPLREHRSDIVPLAHHFVSTLGAANGRADASLTSEAIALLQAQTWEGNVRELQNFIERLLVLSPEGQPLGEADVRRELARKGIGPSAAPGVAAGTTNDTLDSRRRDAERTALEEAIAKARGNKAQAARLLGISRRTLYNKLESLGRG